MTSTRIAPRLVGWVEPQAKPIKPFGPKHEARKLIEASVRSHRVAMKLKSGQPAFEKALAYALNTVGVELRTKKQYRAALTLCQEAVSKRRILLLLAVVSVTGIFDVHAATAQPVSVMQPPVQSTLPYCKRSTLTNVEFMQTVQTVISHGDLTDIPFIEKTLRTRFTISYGLQSDGAPDRQTVFFNSNQILDSPIPTQLRIFYAKSQQIQTHIIAALAMGDSQSNFMENCLHITAGYFCSFFGGNFFGGPAGKFIPEATGTQVKDSSGKNGSKIRLNFVYKLQGNLVTGAGILQRP